MKRGPLSIWLLNFMTNTSAGMVSIHKALIVPRGHDHARRPTWKLIDDGENTFGPEVITLSAGSGTTVVPNSYPESMIPSVLN